MVPNWLQTDLHVRKLSNFNFHIHVVTGNSVIFTFFYKHVVTGNSVIFTFFYKLVVTGNSVIFTFFDPIANIILNKNLFAHINFRKKI